jgi:hypothetical protein
VNELLSMAMWAAHVFGAHIAFLARRVTLVHMGKVRQGLVPVALIMVSLASHAQARCVPGPVPGGAAGIERESPTEVRHDGISLDEAVRRAEAQYRARVVRTDVQDEDGRKVYVLKRLSEDGRVITVRIDAATGRMR